MRTTGGEALKLPLQNGLFASHRAIGESGKVRLANIARCDMKTSHRAMLSCCTVRSSAMAGCDVRVSHGAEFFELFWAKLA